MRPQWFLSWYPAFMYQKGLQSDRCHAADPKLIPSSLVFLSLLSPSNLAIEFAARLLGFVVMFIMVYDAIVSEHIPAFVMLLQTRRHRSRTAPEHYWDDFLEIWVLPSWSEAIFSLYFTWLINHLYEYISRAVNHFGLQLPLCRMWTSTCILSVPKDQVFSGKGQLRAVHCIVDFYHCPEGNFNLHLYCFHLPQTIKCKHHIDLITLDKSSGKDDLGKF